jgi:hypothetical protein
MPTLTRHGTRAMASPARPPPPPASPMKPPPLVTAGARAAAAKPAAAAAAHKPAAPVDTFPGAVPVPHGWTEHWSARQNAPYYKGPAGEVSWTLPGQDAAVDFEHETDARPAAPAASAKTALRLAQAAAKSKRFVAKPSAQKD